MLYEAVALAMRFWFIIAILIILLGSVGISVKEYRQKHYVLSLASSSIGYLSVLSGPEDVLGENLQLMQQNTVGRSRRADINIADRSVDKAHCLIYKEEMGDVILSRISKGDISVNGVQVEDSALLFTGDIVCFGNIVTELHIKEEE